ncbi:hypothetical protein SAMN03097699_0328 [Flavobacteriaceae bacterium MAR_2010_188]|nr:hypothetical protein SAMN03097699_0328 [Flavobacteriaceae bacterium MAR_2010_188]
MRNNIPFYLIVLTISPFQLIAQSGNSSYENLIALFKEWRAFEKPPLLNGAPDYTKVTFEKRCLEFKGSWEMTGVQSYLGQ